MYMQAFKCNVTNSVLTDSAQIAPAKPPVWCEDDETKCVKGPKQMIYYGQAEGNNVPIIDGRRPGYNKRMGFNPGAF